MFDPELSVGYTPRGSWKALAKQYFEYGQWKGLVLQKHPDSLKVRQLLPAMVTAVLAVCTAFGLRNRRVLGVPLAYGALVAIVTRKPRVAGVVATIHLAWGAGFWSSLSRLVSRVVSARRRPR